MLYEDQREQQARTAILVLGMHRSGTSAVTRCLNILGAALPERLMQSAPANPLGHFEPKEIVNIHDRLLVEAGSSWADWSAFPQEWYHSNAREVFFSELSEAIDADYAGSEVFTVKDPRLVRFIPLWRELLENFHVRTVAVLPYRNPIEVALSLNHRDKLPIEHGLLLWLRHVLDAEHHSRDFPRHFISYEKLLEHKQKSIYRLIEAIPVTWPRRTAKAFDEISEFLDSKLRRHAASVADLSLHKEIPKEVRDVYEAYERLSADPQDAAAMSQLDDLRADFERTSGLLSATFRQLRERFEADHMSFVAHRERAEALAEKVAQQDERLAADRARAEALAEKVAQQDERLAADRARTEALAEKVAQQDERLAADRARAEALAEKVAQQDERLATDRAHAEALAEKVAQQDERLATDRARTEALAEKVAQQDERLATDRARTEVLAEQVARQDERSSSFEQRLAAAEAFTDALATDLAASQKTTQLQWDALQTLHGSLSRAIGQLREAGRVRDQDKRARIWWPAPKKAWGPHHKLVLKSGLFDPDWYREAYGLDAKIDALDHFVQIGSRQGHSPGPLFNAQWYLEANPDIADQGIEPLTHYLTFGRVEGRSPIRQSSPTS